MRGAIAHASAAGGRGADRVPPRMASVAVTPFAVRYRPAGGVLSGLTPGFRLRRHRPARVERTCSLSATRSWTTLRAVRSRTRRPLARRAGRCLRARFLEHGDLIVFPLLSIQTLKHIADRWALWLSVDWFAGWAREGPGRPRAVQRPAVSQWRSLVRDRAGPRGDPTGHGANRRGRRSAGVGQTRRLRTGFRAGGAAGRGTSALPAARSPSTWVTLGLFPTRRPLPSPVLPMPPPPTGPVVTPPRMVHWFGRNGSLSFNW